MPGERVRSKILGLRLGEAHDALLADLVAETRRPIVEELRIAIEERHRRVLGRRMADLVAVKDRRAGERPRG